jgi:rhodanese-related sulfurtransferase
MQVLTLDQFMEMWETHPNMPVIDVLSHESYEEQHIPNTQNVPVTLDLFENIVLRRVGERTNPLVLYCAGPGCTASKKAANILERAGFDQVYVFEGGLQEWVEADMPVASGVAVREGGEEDTGAVITEGHDEDLE